MEKTPEQASAQDPISNLDDATDIGLYYCPTPVDTSEPRALTPGEFADLRDNFNEQFLVGKSREAAERYMTLLGCKWRVVSINHREQFVSRGRSQGRLNLWLVDNVVTKIVREV